MTQRPRALTSVLALGALLTSVSIAASAEVAGAFHAAQSAPLTPQLAAARPILGTWVYAKDQTGVVPSEAVYEGSAITFGADGVYTFQLGQSTIALKGTWEVRGVDGDTVRVHTEYGKGRRNDLTLTLRRNPAGAAVGMEVREGDGSTGARYYVPRPS